MSVDSDEKLTTRELHQMLLRLAGKGPDDLLTQARTWLAGGELDALAKAVTFFASSTNTPLADADLVVLAELMDAADADLSALAGIDVDNADRYPPYEFAAQPPAQADAADATGPGTTQGADKAEQSLVKALAREEGALGAWRTWRFPADGSPWPPPRRVFVVEVADGTDEAPLTARLQQRLSAARETSPQVEVYPTGYELPIYQRLARAYADLIWSAAEDPDMQIASVFDEVDADAGSQFHSDHARLDAAEAAKVAQYLYQGEPILVTTARMDDVMDTSRVYSVPMSFRTDGTWIWTEASAYYTEVHRLEPDSGLLAHIRSADYRPPAVDGVALYRALNVLQTPAGDEPAPEDPGAVD